MGGCLSKFADPPYSASRVRHSIMSPDKWTNDNWTWMAKAILEHPVEKVIRDLVLFHPPKGCGLSLCNDVQLQTVVDELLLKKEVIKRNAITKFPVNRTTFHITLFRILVKLQTQDEKVIHGYKRRKTFLKEQLKWGDHGFGGFNLTDRKRFDEFNKLKVQIESQLLDLKNQIFEPSRGNDLHFRKEFYTDDDWASKNIGMDNMVSSGSETSSSSSAPSGCFDGDAQVLMADGSRKAIREIRAGDRVRSFPHSESTVQCAVAWKTEKMMKMTLLNDQFWVTYKHPILIGMDGRDYSGLQRLDETNLKIHSLRWMLPKNVGVTKMKYQRSVHNLMLNADCHHTISISGTWCCSLGGGHVGKIMQHQLWNNREAVQQYLSYQSSTHPNSPNKPRVCIYQ